MATDAAFEGLNLQTLGTLINVDLPWNPARLEQRLGRIKRIGQLRHTFDMLNLVYHGTQDERVYWAISRRMKDRYDIFGGRQTLSRTTGIESAEKLEEMMDRYIHLRQAAHDVLQPPRLLAAGHRLRAPTSPARREPPPAQSVLAVSDRAQARGGRCR